MSTIYTVNGKVLKNSANDKWLTKKEAPAGFVMNASNVQYNTMGTFTYAYWEGPNFPNGYDGNGKQCTIVNSNSSAHKLMYANEVKGGGPDAIVSANLVTGTTTMLANLAGVASGYGKYMSIEFSSEEEARSYIANLTITILD
jgi:hypothetical protein